MRKESAGLKWNAVFAVAVILLVALPGSRMALAGEMINVIPQPAQAEFRQGSFAIRAGTRIALPRDPRAARVARYFADLMQRTRGMQLKFSASAAPEVVAASAHSTTAASGAATTLPRDATSNATPASAPDGDIVFELRPAAGAKGSANTDAGPAVRNPEGYTLDVGPRPRRDCG